MTGPGARDGRAVYSEGAPHSPRAARMSTLHLATIAGDAAAVKLLVAHGATQRPMGREDINLLDNGGNLQLPTNSTTSHDVYFTLPVRLGAPLLALALTALTALDGPDGGPAPPECAASISAV